LDPNETRTVDDVSKTTVSHAETPSAQRTKIATWTGIDRIYRMGIGEGEVKAVFLSLHPVDPVDPVRPSSTACLEPLRDRLHSSDMISD